MTTIFGLRHPNVDAAVLVADRQTTSVDGRGIPIGKYIGRKLWKSDDEQFCFGHVGNRNEETERLAEDLYSGKIDVEKIVNKGYFPELRKLNIKRMGRGFPDPNQMSGIILATRFSKDPKMYTCFPLGGVEQRVWTCAGSGEQKIHEYMNAINTLSEAREYIGETSKMEIGDVIRIGLEAVRRAQSQDAYSHGLDMLICTPKGINDHRKNLEDDFKKKLKKIQKQYK